MEITKENLEDIVEMTCSELASEILSSKIISQEDLKIKTKVFLSLAIKKNASQVSKELNNQREKLLTQMRIGQKDPKSKELEIGEVNYKIKKANRVWEQAKVVSDKITYAKAIHQVILERLGETELLQIIKKAQEVQNKSR